jgi:hypothetical protein
MHPRNVLGRVENAIHECSSKVHRSAEYYRQQVTCNISDLANGLHFLRHSYLVGVANHPSRHDFRS